MIQKDSRENRKSKGDLIMRVRVCMDLREPYMLVSRDMPAAILSSV